MTLTKTPYKIQNAFVSISRNKKISPALKTDINQRTDGKSKSNK